MLDAFLCVTCAGGMLALVAGHWRDARALQVVGKPVASAAFVALGITHLGTGRAYVALVLVALLLCLLGDMLLMVARLFVVGLASFLAAHLVLIAAFHSLSPARSWPFVAAVPVLAASAAAARWLSPRLGRRRFAVLAYIAVITVMVWGALSVVIGGWAPARVAAGAVLFYLSDLAVARDRFVAHSFANRAVGLPLYYVGQLLLASTTGL
jgi:uncharacterized membrane protein YhhN